MTNYNGKIAEDWLPTYENVTREFVTETLYRMIFGEKLPNFLFDFREPEAMGFVENLLNQQVEEYDFYAERNQKLIDKLKSKTDENSELPVMVVNDYKQFFENLRQFYESYIELYFKEWPGMAFTRDAKENCFEQIWLRATPDDFNNPEEFLRKQAMMISDTTFEKYDEEVEIGPVDFFDGNILCIKNGIARIWDENSRQIEIKIYNKEIYNPKAEGIKGSYYELPVIRYGIYEKDDNKVCMINSIQDKKYGFDRNKFEKKLERKKYKVNQDIAEEDTEKVEPKNLMALSIFINMLAREGITEVEVPSMYVLDYEYHVRRNPEILANFQKHWDEDKIQRRPNAYKTAKYHFDRTYQKEDVISEIKTERLLLTFRRLLQHYPNGSIVSYPGEADSFMHLNIPVTRSEHELAGDAFKALYRLKKEEDVEI